MSAIFFDEIESDSETESESEEEMSQLISGKFVVFLCDLKVLCIVL